MPCTIQVCTNSRRPAFCRKWTQRSVLRRLLLLLLIRAKFLLPMISRNELSITLSTLLLRPSLADNVLSINYKKKIDENLPIFKNSFQYTNWELAVPATGWHHVPNVWHIIYNHSCICSYPPEILQLIDGTCTSRYSSTTATGWHHVPNVWHIYNHSRICSCPPETLSVTFDISSMLTVVYDCFSHCTIPYLAYHTVPGVPYRTWRTILLDISSMIILLYVCVFQS